MVEFSEKRLAYISIGIAGLSAIMSITQGGGIIALLGAIFAGLGALLGVVFLKYGYIVVPLLTSKGNVVMITDSGYEINPKQDTIIKRTSSGIYYASVFLGIRIYQSNLELTQTQIMNYNKSFERAMSNFRRVVKVAYMMHSMDISEKKKEYEEKKAEAQLRLQREREKLEPDILKIQRYEKEAAYYEHQIDRLIKGERPMRVVCYAMVTETGITKEEAISKAKSSAYELRTLLSNSLNVDVDILQGDEMLKIFEWEKFMPVTPEELEDKTELQIRRQLV